MLAKHTSGHYQVVWIWIRNPSVLKHDKMNINAFILEKNCYAASCLNSLSFDLSVHSKRAIIITVLVLAGIESRKT